jgi:hypothetical protein
MAGTIPLSMTQQLDLYGKPLAGGQLFIIQAGTVSTPQDAFQDTNLTIKQPYPMTLDAAGRVPQFFLADGTVKIRLQDVKGVVQLASDSVLVIGPSAGGGGGSPVDPTQLIQTGNMILRYGVGILPGYVRMNGLSIGSTTSGATERANPDCQNAFQYLWGADPNLVLVPARGTTAALDWAANKQLFLPDWRGYAVGALDDMGNSPAGRLTPAYFGTAAVVLGAVGGGESYPLAAAQLPVITPSGGVSVLSNTLTAPIPVRNFINSGSTVPSEISLGSNIASSAGALNVAITGSMTFNLSMNSFGGGQAHRTIGPRKLCTIYLKL